MTPQEIYYDEYAPAAPTTRLDTTPAWLPRDTRPLLALGGLLLALVAAGVVWRASIFATGFKAGALAGYTAGALQPWVDDRGWIALLFVAIGLPILAIYRANRTYTYPELP